MSEVLSFASTGWGTQLLLGLLVTLGLAVPAFLLGSLLGTLAATVRHRGHALSAGTIAVYTTLVRGLPELLVIYLIFFGGEQLLRSITSLVGYNRDFHPDPYVAGLLSLTLISGAYTTEVIRGAFKVLDAGQTEAARAFGWTRTGAFWRIEVPQLVRIALPGLANVWLGTLKDTALVSVIGLTELMRAATVATGSTDLPFYFYGAATVLYLAASAASSLMFKALERHSRRGMRTVTV